jgi:hypothetical protein
VKSMSSTGIYWWEKISENDILIFKNIEIMV